MPLPLRSEKILVTELKLVIPRDNNSRCDRCVLSPSKCHDLDDQLDCEDGYFTLEVLEEETI